MIDGVGVIFHAAVGHGTEELGHKIVLEFLSGGIERAQGSLGFIGVDLRPSQVVIGLLKVRVQQNGFVKVFDGLFGLFVFIGNASQQIIQLRVGRIVADQRLELFGSLLAVLGAKIEFGQFFAQARQRRKPFH